MTPEPLAALAALPAAVVDLRDLFGLFGHFMVLSLLSIGGAMTAAPDMHRYLVGEQRWLDDAQFSTSIAIAQAAPGPNVLFVAVLGWNVAGLPGAVATLAGILLPSAALSLGATRWSRRRRESRGVRAFNAGLAPVTLGLLLSTGWVLAAPYLADPAHRLGAMALIGVSVPVMLFSRLGPMWLVGLGALAGGLGWA